MNSTKYRPRIACMALIAAAFATGGPLDAAPPNPDAPRTPPELSVSQTGVTVNWDGKALIADAVPEAEKITLEDRRVDPENNLWQYDYREASLEDAQAATDRQEQQAARQYEWGEVRVAYELDGNHLKLAVELENQTKSAIADFRVRLLTLNLPNKPKALETKHRRYGKGLHESTLDQATALEVDAPQGKLFASYDSFAPPIRFGIDGAAADDPGRYPMYIAGGVRAVPRGEVVAPQMGLPYLPPGQTLKLRFSIRFAAADARRGEVLRPFYRMFREFQSPMLEWPDRRPIGASFLMQEFGKEPAKFGQEGVNPRRWFSMIIEMDSPEGRSLLRKQMRGLAYSSLRAAARMNAQGVLLWNVEGGFHSTGWVGDPRMLPILSPELDKAIDDYFRIIREGGFTPGVTLRPGQVRWNDGRNNWSQGAGNYDPKDNPVLDKFDKYLEAHPHEPWWRVYPVAERLANKIEYAKKRWGCKIFYIDTNFVHRGWGPKQKFGGRLMETHIFRKVREAHPDVLIIPEIMKGRTAYLAQIAPYGQLGYGRVRSRYGPDWTRDLLPGYFGTNYVSDGDLWGSRVQRVQELARGLIFFFQGWGWSNNSNAVIEFTNQARANQARVTALARRYGLVDRPGEARPFSEAFENARPIHPNAIVADPPAGQQLRVFTESSEDRRDAIVMCTWLGNPHAPGTVLKPDLPGVELEGRHRKVWDVASGDLISSTAGVVVPSDPVTGMRALFVRASDESPRPPRPDGLRLAVSFDDGLGPDLGGGLLDDNGDAPRVRSPHGRALKITPGGGAARYGSVPNWYAGTLEFNLRVANADDKPMSLVRFQHHMDTTLSLVRRNGKPALVLETYERPSHVGYWKDTSLSPDPDPTAPPVRKQAVAPLPDNTDWHRVTLVWDMGNYLVYVNGKQVAMISEPFIMRWRDGTIFEPGLVLGGGKNGGTAEAHLDSVMLYGWNFDAEQASGRDTVVALNPLARPEDTKPSVWLWGHKPENADRIAVNVRRVTKGERSWGVKAELFERTKGGLRKLSSGSGSPYRGTALLIFEHEPEAPPAGGEELLNQPDDGEVLYGVEELLEETKKYVLKVTARAPGEDSPQREIEFEFGTEKKSVHHW